jgi:hypothetical protein
LKSKFLEQDEAVYYHTRITWITDNVTDVKNLTKSDPYDKRLKEFFTEDLRKIVHTNYLNVMSIAMEFFGEDPSPHYELLDVIFGCLNG